MLNSFLLNCIACEGFTLFVDQQRTTCITNKNLHCQRMPPSSINCKVIAICFADENDQDDDGDEGDDGGDDEVDELVSCVKGSKNGKQRTTVPLQVNRRQ